MWHGSRPRWLRWTSATPPRVIFLAREDALIDQLLRAPEIDFGQIALRFERRQLRALLARIEFHDDVAFLHGLSGLEVNLRHRARQIGAHHHAVNGSMLPMTDRLAGQTSCLATTLVTASGGGAKLAPPAQRLHLLELYEAEGPQHHYGEDNISTILLAINAPYRW